MTGFTVRKARRSALDRCPSCGTQMRIAAGDSFTNYFCPECTRCWHHEMLWTTTVLSDDCPGCRYEHVCRETTDAEAVWVDGMRIPEHFFADLD